MRPWIVALVAVLAGIAIALLLITDKSGISEELRLPLLAEISVVTVLMALAFVSTIFASWICRQHSTHSHCRKVRFEH